MNNESELQFESNLVRRVQNLALGPRTPSNALVPVFEALYNSLHAVNDRFSSDWENRARMEVAFAGLSQRQIDVRITDNGVGLNAANFKSFRTYDSPFKAKRGGKGVGRLSWLKVFDHAVISSVFEEDGHFFSRKFRLVLNNEQPIQDYELVEVPPSDTGTTVRLISMRSAYAYHVPVTFDTVLRKLVGHFISFLVTPADRLLSSPPMIRVSI